MKTLKSFLFLIAVNYLLLSCSKSDQLIPGISGLSEDNLKGCYIGGGKVIVVKPSNGDDTKNLQEAFDKAVAYGPGSVVQLIKGNYNIGFIQVREFKGSFIGAGKGKTIISALPGLDLNSQYDQKINPDLIKFVGGDAYIADMTLENLTGQWLRSLVIFSDYSFVYQPKKQFVKGTVNNVEFIGQYISDWYWYTCDEGILCDYDGVIDYSLPGVLNRSHIDLSVTNSSFETLGYGILYGGVKEGKAVCGTRNNGNVFTNIYDAVCFTDFINKVTISVVGNRFNITTGNYGLEVDNYPWTDFVEEPLTKSVICDIEENQFDDAGGDQAIWLHDHEFALHPEDNISMFVTMENNRINMSDEANGGIFMLELQNAIFRNNIFTGAGSDGMYALCKWPDIISKNGLILRNNFTKATFTDAAIYLDYTTQNWSVIGNPNATVINLGVDNVIKDANFNHGNGHSAKQQQYPEDHMNFIMKKFRNHHNN
jgi:hypothetical protein